jgi:hypothetical protein
METARPFAAGRTDVLDALFAAHRGSRPEFKPE